MRLLFLLSCAFVTQFAVAQKTADDTPAKAFEMTKATVEFLATDKKTYGYQAKETCDGCVSYEQLATYIKTNRLTKADELVRDAKRKTDQLLAQKKPGNVVLAELKNYLIDRVTGGQERKHRFSLKSFPAYQKQLNQLAGVPQTANPVAQEPVSDQESQDVAPDTLITEPSVVDESTNTSKTTTTDLFSMSGLALLLSLVSLGGFLFLYTRKPKVQEAGSSDAKLAQLSDKIFHLEADRKELVKAVQSLNAKVQQLEGLLKTTTASQRQAPAPPVDPLRSVLEEPINEPKPRPATEAVNRPKSQPATIQNTERKTQHIEPQSQPTERYARTADLGDGFSLGGLLSVAERGAIYHLMIDGNQAVYRVVDNSDAQQLALSDPYSYLGDACEYQNQPRLGARIQTEQPGRLTLQGEKWKIEQKAKISFV